MIVSIGGVSRSRQEDSGTLQVELFVSTNAGTAVLSQDALSVAVEVCVAFSLKMMHEVLKTMPV